MLQPGQIEALSGHFRKVLGLDHIEIANIRRFHGGASRETYSLDVAGCGLILRRDPADSLIDTDRRVEFAALKSFEGARLPIPRVVSIVETPDLIGAPFFVMERIEGGEAASPFDPNAYGDTKPQVGARFFELLGNIHAADAVSSPLGSAIDVPGADRCWARELDYWAGVIEKDALQPEPIAQGAIRWLRRNPPPPASRLAIVHGDYRTGNVLHDGKGGIVAILDWEMAHIGDPHEDLAWALDPLWSLGNAGLAAGMIPREEAIARWEDASGLSFDPAVFRWWEMFATLKGLAIWLSSAKAYADGANTDPILAFSGWYPKVEGDRILAARLAAAGA